MLIWTYIRALSRVWWALMSCAAFTILSLILTKVPAEKSSTLLVLVTAVLAVVFFFYASFRVWKDEHEKYTIEAEKNSKPSLTGQISNFKLAGPLGSDVYQGKWTNHGVFSFDAYVCNARPRTTSLKEIRLDGSSLDPPVVFSGVRIGRNSSGTPLSSVVLRDGIGVSLAGLEVDVELPGAVQFSIALVELDDLKAFGVDSFLGQHPLSVGKDEQLSFVY